jgi:hypothetical protein
MFPPTSRWSRGTLRKLNSRERFSREDGGCVNEVNTGTKERRNETNVSSSAAFTFGSFFLFVPVHSVHAATSYSQDKVAARVRMKEKESAANTQQRLTFPFPFVHLQPLDCKLEQLNTVETKSQGLVFPRVVPVRLRLTLTQLLPFRKLLRMQPSQRFG